MGATLSADQTHFLESFATSPSLGNDELASGLQRLEPQLVGTVADCTMPSSTVELLRRHSDTLFIRAVESNRIALAVDYARAQLDLIAATRANGGAVEKTLVSHAATALRFAQMLVSLAISRHDGGLAVVSKLCGGAHEALKHLQGSTVLVVAQGIDATTPEGLRLLAEALLFLLTLSSTALYHAALPDGHDDIVTSSSSGGASSSDVYADSFIDAVVYHEDPALARVFVSRLLAVAALWGTGRLTPQLEYKTGYQPAFYNLYNWFGLTNRGQRVDVAACVAGRATQLASIYMTYKKPSHVAARRVNCIVDLLQRLGKDASGDPALSKPQNDADPAQPLPGSIVSIFGPNTPAPSLFELGVLLSRKLHELPELTTVLYAMLLYRKQAVMHLLCPPNPSDYSMGTLNAKVLADLLENLAHCAYDCVGSEGIAPLTFLVGTVLLLFSTETGFVTRLFNTKVTAKWYKERYMGDVDAGSLIVTVVARTAARAVAQGNNDIAELNLGILANMAPYVHHLHIVAGQRLATMLKHMLKRLVVARDAVARDSTDYVSAASYKAVETHCCLTIDTMLGILDGSSRENHSLLYDLLHQKPEIFTVTAQFAPGSAISDAAAPLAKLVSFYEAELTSFCTTSSVDDVMRVIRKVADDVSAPDIVVGTGAQRGGGGAAAGTNAGADESTISACERNVFEYVEDDDAYEYFASLLWRTVLARSGPVLLLPAAVVMANRGDEDGAASATATHMNLRLLSEPSREV